MQLVLVIISIFTTGSDLHAEIIMIVLVKKSLVLVIEKSIFGITDVFRTQQGSTTHRENNLR